MFDPLQINQEAFSYYERLGRVRSFVEQHYEEDLTLTRLAGVAGLEPRYFSAFFHRKIGVRLSDWITHLRVCEAAELMRSHNYTISQVAGSVGFNDLRTFERAFKRCRQQTPFEYKKSVRPS